MRKSANLSKKLTDNYHNSVVNQIKICYLCAQSCYGRAILYNAITIHMKGFIAITVLMPLQKESYN